MSSEEFKAAIEKLKKSRDCIKEEFAKYNKLMSEGKIEEAWESLNILLKVTNEGLRETQNILPAIKDKLEGRISNTDSQENQTSISKGENKKIPKMIVIPKQTKPI